MPHLKTTKPRDRDIFFDNILFIPMVMKLCDPKFERHFVKNSNYGSLFQVFNLSNFLLSAVIQYNKARILNKTIGDVQSHSESSVLHD